MPRDLKLFFNPRSVAVVGASQVPTKVGSVALQNLISSGYLGKIYPINSHLDHVGLMPFFSKIDLLPEIPDLVIIAIPAAAVLDEIKSCAEFGCKNFIIYTSGFKEIGTGGDALEKQLFELATEYSLNILGPNCLGFASPQNSLNATFGQNIKQSGNLKIVSQSGAIVSSFFEFCQKNNFGFDTCITLGNKTVISENDILEYWQDSPSPVGLYLESITDGQQFLRLISQVSRHHPVFILKPGKSTQAATAMKSHTGSIATPDFILDAAIRQSGAIRCHDIGEFFNLAHTISQSKIPAGPRVAIVSNAGGPSVLATDNLIASGLQLAQINSETKLKLSSVLPSFASLNNPIDLMGDAQSDRFRQSLEIIIQDPNVDSALVILTPQLMTQIPQTAQVIADISQTTSKLILSAFIPTDYPEDKIKVLSSLWRWQQWRQKQSDPIATPIPSDLIISTLSSSLPNQLPQNLLSALKIPTPATSFVTTLDEASIFAKKNSYPLVLKVSSNKILHKTEVGGVVLNITNISELTSAYNHLITVSPQLQIQTQIDHGIEVIIGFKRDPTFGPIILFGSGGKFAEIISDRNLSLLPLSPNNLRELVNKSLVSKLLSGFRGDTSYNLEPLFQTIETLSQLFLDYPQISEMEINPLIVTHHGVCALDPKIILSEK